MKIFPAIDIREGKVVRLTQGDYDRMEVYDNDPVAVARQFKAAGAEYLHIVDLDGAREGRPQNWAVLSALAKEGSLFLQVGGGLRTPESVREILELGIDRVILGTAALRDPDFLKRMLAMYGGRIAVGVDTREGKVAVDGWLEVTETDALSFCRHLRGIGVQTVIYTDIARDGALAGVNLSPYRALCEIEGLAVIASGGVSGEADIVALREMNVHGVIVGKALYTGRLELGRVLVLAGKESIE